MRVVTSASFSQRTTRVKLGQADDFTDDAVTPAMAVMGQLAVVLRLAPTSTKP
jgi:hypothetical protein